MASGHGVVAAVPYHGRRPPGPHGSPPLDDPLNPNPASDDRFGAPGDAREGSSAPPSPPEAPGLGAQIGATRASVTRLVTAHVELAKAEFAEISDRLKAVAILAGIAAAVGLGAGLLMLVGLPLFLGDLFFGSIGWGLLLGLLLFTDIGIASGIGIANEGLGVDTEAIERAEEARWSMDPEAAELAQRETDAALRARPRVARRVVFGSLLVAVLIGTGVGVLLGLDLTNRAWTAAGDAILPGVESGARPLAMAVLALAILFGIIGLIGGARSGGVKSAIGGLIAGALAGVALGALTAIATGPRVGAAIGVATALIAWAALMGTAAARSGFSGRAFTLSVKPERTIETAKETIQWARDRMPLSRKS